jgi:ferrous-iron efflux pump FieF
VLFALNAALTAAHFFVFAVTRSRLVLAQGADSLIDVAMVAILAFSAHVGARAKDEGHPFGHDRAEPVGAFVSSVLAGVLVLEVVKSAVMAIWFAEHAEMDTSVLAVLAAKFVVKCLFIALLVRAATGPAVRAMIADSKNDLATITASSLAFFAVRKGYPLADPLMALGICAYIARNTYAVFRENLRFLMGEAPDPPVLEAMRKAAASVPGVEAVTDIAAHYVGSHLHVEVTVQVSAQASARESHAVSEGVQQIIEALDEVARAFVHVDVALGEHAHRKDTPIKEGG